MSFPVTYEQEQSPKLTPAVQALLAINIAVAFLQLTLVYSLSDVLAFDFNALPGRWWAATTYMFAHVSVWHLAANMYGLYLFGPRLEQAWGAKKFTWFYLLCGFGGVAFEILFLRAGTLVGASAAVFGVMTAYVMQWPDDEVSLLGVLPMRARSLVVGLVVFNVVMGVMGVMATADGMNVAYLAHAGGIVTAYVYVRMSVSTGMEQVRQRVANLPEADEPPRAIPRNMPRRERADEVDDIVAKSKAIAAKRAPSLTPTSRRREGKADELNRVLDKISELGIESLTSDERKTLEEMSKKLRGT
jgi:membrane associated rhomboid family serine protease